MDRVYTRMIMVLLGISFISAGVICFSDALEWNEVDCADCVTIECMDNDPICGDFGQYYFLFMLYWGVILMGILLLGLAFLAEFSRH